MVQTPQVFAAEALRKAYEQEFSELFTDDASVMEAAGHTIKLCEGEQQNIKITRPEDITIAEAIIASREQESDAF
jgi:2-C-methyl-D-erythritol 4-phosphate cytidylyltransferase